MGSESKMPVISRATLEKVGHLINGDEEVEGLELLDELVEDQPHVGFLIGGLLTMNPGDGGPNSEHAMIVRGILVLWIALKRQAESNELKEQTSD